MESCKAVLSVLLLASFCAMITAGSLKFGEDDLNEPEISLLPGMILPNLEDPLEEGNNPQPCCMPKQWQGNVTSQTGWYTRRRGGDQNDRRGGKRSGFRSQTVTLFMDEDKKKIAGRVRCRNDTCGFIITFGDNKTADVYFFALGAQKCFHNKSARAEFGKQCLPANATFEGSANLGPATGGLNVQRWSFHVASRYGSNPQPKVYIGGRATVTPDKCIPVVVQEFGLIRFRPRPHEGTDDDEADCDDADLDDFGVGKRYGCGGTRFMSSAFFSNMEPSVKDPTVFNPPSYCKGLGAPGGSLKLGVDVEYPEVLDRFVLLN